MLRIILSLCLFLAALTLASCSPGDDQIPAETRRTRTSTGVGGMAARMMLPRRQQWEYKVVKMDENAEQDLTGFLNANAAGGWEYVGQLSGKSEHLVFKRAINEGATTLPGRPGWRVTTGVGGRTNK